MSNKIIFYSNQNSNRLQYIIQLVFAETLGWDVFFTQNEKAYLDSTLPKVQYGDVEISEDGYFIEALNSLIFENIIIKRDFEKEFHQFDIFSKIFVMVSRYEEYIADPSVFDRHQRFPASQSFASKLNMLRQPVVNQWIINLKNDLIQKYPNLKSISPNTEYKLQLTYDIDQAWAFKNKGFLRNIGGMLRDFFKLNFKIAFNRLAVILRISNDPEFTFDYIDKLHKKYESKINTPIFFWLLGDYGAFDKNIAWQNKSLQRLIRRISKKYHVGIHPSYASNADFTILINEIARLNSITQSPNHLITQSPNHPIIKSRQHYLKLTFPDTFRRLIQAGIQDDYSMGYADDIGFRAGMATPFYWYDLENEQVTHLKIYPFQVMEVTLMEYLKLTPEEAIEEVKPLIAATKAVGGTFTTLWHNSTLSKNETENWREVYEKIIAEAILD